MSQSELLKRIVSVLDRTGTPYMLSGSYASSLQGEPRLTHDVDLVVELATTSIAAFSDAFPPPDYYLDEQSAADAVASKGQFNLIDVTSGDKVDFWLLTGDAFDQSRFARRYTETFEGMNIFVSRPEDTILMKLRWAEMSGGSEKQFGDALGVFQLQATILDMTYLHHWAGRIGVAGLFERLRIAAQQD